MLSHRYLQQILKKAQCQRAFTLLEALLVLTITALIISLFTYLPSKNFSQLSELNQFRRYLTSQLYLAQEKALIEQGQISVRIRPYEAIQFFNNQTGSTYLYLNPPADWDVISHHTFHYNSLGRVNNFKTVVFQHQTGKNFSLVFQLGSGRFEFQE